MKNINKIRLIVLLSGFISMELEILGTRLISPIFGSTIYVWTSLIGVTLTFLALGYWYGGKLADKGKINLNKLGLIILLLGVYICLLPFISKAILYQVNSLGIIFGPLLISFVILAFPIFFLGFVVPTSVKLSTEFLSEIGRKAGQIYALATVGSIIGTFATGFFLILYLGITKTALITGAILIVLSLILMTPKKNKKISLIFLLIPLLLFFVIPKVSPLIIYSDSGYYSEIKVTHEVIGGHNVRQLILDNAVQTIKTDNPNYFNYVNFFKIPFYFRNISSVLMIGLGGGEGIKMLHNDYNVEIDVIELDPKLKFVAEKYFDLNISNFNIITNDARNYFLTTDKKYDLIISDIGFVDWSPYLFTTEFYEIVENHLSDDGIFMINVIAIKEGKDSVLAKSIYSDLNKTFEDVLIFRNPKVPDDEFDNIFFLASKQKIWNKPLALSGQIFLDSILQKSFTYNETLDFENKDDLVFVEKYSLKMRGLYFDSSMEDIKRLN